MHYINIWLNIYWFLNVLKLTRSNIYHFRFVLIFLRFENFTTWILSQFARVSRILNASLLVLRCILSRFFVQIRIVEKSRKFVNNILHSASFHFVEIFFTKKSKFPILLINTIKNHLVAILAYIEPSGLALLLSNKISKVNSSHLQLPSGEAF